METATAYKSTFFVIDCPYCGHKHYLDTEDMYSENIDGKKMACERCGKVFRMEE